LETKEKMQFPLIANDNKKCVWMELGIVSYKICDRNFQCETCPLDVGLRGDKSLRNHSLQEPQETAEANSRPLSFSQQSDSSLDHFLKFKEDKNCYIHPSHCWINVLSDNQAKIGIDNVVATTLGSIDDIVLPMPDEAINRGDEIGQIIQCEHIFSIVSPISGQVIKINDELADFPNELTLDPFEKGWMVLILPDNLKQDLKYCRSGDALFSWYLKELKWLESNLVKGFQQNPEGLGFTLNDGGEISRNLRNYLPQEKYRKLVLSLLGMPNSTC